MKELEADGVGGAAFFQGAGRVGSESHSRFVHVCAGRFGSLGDASIAARRFLDLGLIASTKWTPTLLRRVRHPHARWMRGRPCALSRPVSIDVPCVNFAVGLLASIF